jgi:hypothetical protein
LTVLGFCALLTNARAAGGLQIDVEARIDALLARMTLDEKLEPGEFRVRVSSSSVGGLQGTFRVTP